MAELTGRELDVAIGRLLGCLVHQNLGDIEPFCGCSQGRRKPTRLSKHVWPGPHDADNAILKPYSSDIGAAWEVVEYMTREFNSRERVAFFDVLEEIGDKEVGACIGGEWTLLALAHKGLLTLAAAICQAALKAKESKP